MVEVRCSSRDSPICCKYVLASVNRLHAVGGVRGYLEVIDEWLEGEGGGLKSMRKILRIIGIKEK